MKELLDKPASLHIFTKIPGKAACKTRLAASGRFSNNAITALSAAFLNDTIRNACDSTQQTIFIHTFPAVSKAEFLAALRLAEDPLNSAIADRFKLLPQTGESFSERFDNAVAEADRVIAGGKVFIGSDAPLLPSRVLRSALNITASGQYSLGPSSGGGLYAIGLPPAARFSFAPIFAATTAPELTLLTAQIQQTGHTATLLEPQFDIDKEDDFVTILSILSAAADKKIYGNAPSTEKTIRALGISISLDPDDNRQVQINTR